MSSELCSEQAARSADGSIAPPQDLSSSDSRGSHFTRSGVLAITLGSLLAVIAVRAHNHGDGHQPTVRAPEYLSGTATDGSRFEVWRKSGGRVTMLIHASSATTCSPPARLLYG